MNRIEEVVVFSNTFLDTSIYLIRSMTVLGAGMIGLPSFQSCRTGDLNFPSNEKKLVKSADYENRNRGVCGHSQGHRSE